MARWNSLSPADLTGGKRANKQVAVQYLLKRLDQHFYFLTNSTLHKGWNDSRQASCCLRGLAGSSASIFHQCDTLKVFWANCTWTTATNKTTCYFVTLADNSLSFSASCGDMMPLHAKDSQFVVSFWSVDWAMKTKWTLANLNKDRTECCPSTCGL